MHAFTIIILFDEMQLAWYASMARILTRKAGFLYAGRTVLSQCFYLPLRASNNSHLRRKTEFMNGNSETRRYTSVFMVRDAARVRKFAEEKVFDDDDIIATMVMVSAIWIRSSW